jgi:hypothetical protein
MKPRIRKFLLTAHVTSSVGWVGAALAYLSLAVAGLTSHEPPTVRGAFLCMELIGWFIIVPLSLLALSTGLIQSLATDWGLFRHYWILAKFVITIVGTTVLLLHLPSVSHMAGLAPDPKLFSAAFAASPQATFVIHAAGGSLLLLIATVLSIYKPWGLTPYGRGLSSPPVPPQSLATPNPAAPSNTRWPLYVLLAIIALVVLLIVQHLSGGGMRHH